MSRQRVVGAAISTDRSAFEHLEGASLEQDAQCDFLLVAGFERALLVRMPRQEIITARNADEAMGFSAFRAFDL